MSSETVLAIINKNKVHGDGVISILDEIQSKYGYLPEDALRMVADKLKRPLTEIYGVATFYKSFSLIPKGDNHITVCLGTACHVRGGPAIADEFQKQLGIAPGETSEDRRYSLETVNCLGACALGPVVVVNGRYKSKVKENKVKGIIEEADKELDSVDFHKAEGAFPIEVSCLKCNHSLMDPYVLIDGKPSIRLTMSFGRKHGSLRLTSIYGSYKIKTEYEIPMDTVVQFFCPHCHTEFRGGPSCPECGESMVPMRVKGGGIVYICPRRGCSGHLLDI